MVGQDRLVPGRAHWLEPGVGGAPRARTPRSMRVVIRARLGCRTGLVLGVRFCFECCGRAGGEMTVPPTRAPT